jgi:hypothetical protein
MSLSQGFSNTFSSTQQTQEVLKNLDNETKKIYTDINNIMSTHAHTGNGSDGKIITGTGVSATVDQTISTETSNTGTITQLLSWIVKEILAIKGAVTNWYDAAAVSLSTIFGFTWTEKFLIINPSNGYISPLMPLTRNGTGQYFKFYPQGAISSATSIYFFTGTGSLTHASLTNVATIMTPNTAMTFTGTPYVLIDSNGIPEVIKLTAGSGSTNITIARAQLGTVATAHASGGIILDNNVGNVSVSSVAPVSWTASGLTTSSKRDLFAYSVNGTGLSACKVGCVQEWGNR